MMWWYGPDAWPLGWLAMLIGMVLFVAICVAVVWAIIRLASQPAPPRADSALETLRQRFARGEISASEFEEAKRILGLR